MKYILNEQEKNNMNNKSIKPTSRWLQINKLIVPYFSYVNSSSIHNAVSSQ